MAPKFSVGQNVKVTDQRPVKIGVVKEVSTWKKILGYGTDLPVYLISCENWPKASWIGESNVEAA